MHPFLLGTLDLKGNLEHHYGLNKWLAYIKIKKKTTLQGLNKKNNNKTLWGNSQE